MKSLGYRYDLSGLAAVINHVEGQTYRMNSSTLDFVIERIKANFFDMSGG